MKKFLLLNLLLFSIFASSQEKINKDIEQTAFGDAKFGIAWKDALKCNIFSNKKFKFKKYKKGNIRYLIANNAELGNCKYRIRCIFENDTLSEVTISSYLLNASEYDGQIKNEYLNLKDIFGSKYGDAFINNDYPSILEHKAIYTTWVYGEKVIRLTINEEDFQYYASAIISLVNKNSIERIQESLDIKIKKSKEDSELF